MLYQCSEEDTHKSDIVLIQCLLYKWSDNGRATRDWMMVTQCWVQYLRLQVIMEDRLGCETHSYRRHRLLTCSFWNKIRADLYSYFIYVICPAAVFLICSKQHVCECTGSSKSRFLLCRSSSVADLFCQDQINIALYITMLNSENCHDRTEVIKVYQ